jgi:hypothetical protein
VQSSFNIEVQVLKTNQWNRIVVIVLLISLLNFFIGIEISRRLPRDIFLLVGIPCIIIFAVAPPLFARIKRNLFFKKAMLTVNSEEIKIDIVNKKSFEIESQYNHCFHEICFYTMSETLSDKVSKIDLFLKNDKTVKYIFFDQIENDVNVLKNVYKYISLYNAKQNDKNKIMVKPSFLNTKKGKIIVTGFGLLICVVLLLQFIFKPSTAPYSVIMAIGIYALAKSQQLSDAKLYEKLEAQNNL